LITSKKTVFISLDYISDFMLKESAELKKGYTYRTPNDRTPNYRTPNVHERLK